MNNREPGHYWYYEDYKPPIVIKITKMPGREAWTSIDGHGCKVADLPGKVDDRRIEEPGPERVCRNCENWRGEWEDGGDPTNCKHPMWRYEEYGALPAPKEIVVSSWDEYEPRMATGPEFGCVHWKEKELKK